MTTPEARPAFTMGVEEEFHVVDPATAQLVSDGALVLEQLPDRGPRFSSEIMQSMVETATTVCATLDEVRTELLATRTAMAQAARDADRWIVASGTAPLAERLQSVTDNQRYAEIVARHGRVAREQVVCGCHVHIGVADRDEALAIANRVRMWLPTLLAISTNSPFWDGEDTGYASYRTVMWSRWPSATPFPGFADPGAYDQLIAELIAVGAIRDRGQVYWDLRLSDDNPTLEFRASDVGTRVDDVVLHAALCRALARTAHREAVDGIPPIEVPPELMVAARWSAARFGLDGELVDPVQRTATSGRAMVDALLAHVGDALDADGCRAEVEELAEVVIAQGTGAECQRRLLHKLGSLPEVVAELARRTASGGPG